MILMVFGMFIVSWFSRYREFRGDSSGARLAGKDKMLGALQALQRTVEMLEYREGKSAVQSPKHSSMRSGWMAFFASHPPLEERIAGLKAATG